MSIVLSQGWLKTRALGQGSSEMEKPINLAVFTTFVLQQKNKAAGLAVSAPVAHGGDPLWRRWQVFRSAPLDRKEARP